MTRPHAAREHRHQASILVAEEVFSELLGHPGVWISMTSTPEPGRTRPGQLRATSIASSMVAAVTIMYPPTNSLTSTSGPSGAGWEVTSRPAPNLPPMSVRFFWNFSCHSLNFAYIACICAGDGFPLSWPPPDKLRCKHKYLGMLLSFVRWRRLSD